MTVSLSSLLRPETTLSRLGASGQRAAIHELVGLLIKAYPQLDPNELVSAIQQREKFYSTATIHGLAFPFVETDLVDEPVIALACSLSGVDFGSPQGELTHLFVALVIPASHPKLSMQLLARLTRLFQSYSHLKDDLVSCETPEELYAKFIEVESTL